MSCKSCDEENNVSMLLSHGVSSRQFTEMALLSFRPTYLFLARIPLDIIHECLKLRLEQRPDKDPSLLSLQSVSETREVVVVVAVVVVVVASRPHLRSASQGLLVVPCHHLSSYGRRDFSVAGPAIWNWLPDSLRDPAISRDSFKRSVKTFLFSAYSCT